MQRLNKVWNKFLSGKCILGIGEYLSTYKQSRQKWISVIINGNLIFMNFSYFWTFIDQRRNNASNQLFSGILWLLYSIFHAMFLLMVYHKKMYESCLLWCEKLHLDVKHEPPIKKCFDRCAEESTIFFDYVQNILFATFGLGFSQSIFVSYFVGRFEPHLPVYIPFVPKDWLMNRLLSSFCQILAHLSMNFACILSFGIISVTIKHSMGVLATIKILIHYISISHSEFNDIVKVIATMYVELFQRLESIIFLTEPIMLALEMSIYGILCNISLVLIFEPIMYPFAIATIIFVTLFGFVCWVNEKLAQEFDEVNYALYNVDWLKLRPVKRRSILLLMVMMSRKKLLKSGPFHEATFREFGKIFVRVYFYVILINIFVNKD